MSKYNEDHALHRITLVRALFECSGGAIGDSQYYFDPSFSPMANLEFFGELVVVQGSSFLGSFHANEIQYSLSASAAQGIWEITLDFINKMLWKCGLILCNEDFTIPR